MSRGIPFSKGDARICKNPPGRPKKKLVDEQLVDLLSENNYKRARQIALALLDRARRPGRGQLTAITLVIERTQGKPVQKTDVQLGGAIGLFLTEAQREQRILELLAKREAAALPMSTATEQAAADPVTLQTSALEPKPVPAPEGTVAADT